MSYYSYGTSMLPPARTTTTLGGGSAMRALSTSTTRRTPQGYTPAPSASAYDRGPAATQSQHTGGLGLGLGSSASSFGQRQHTDSDIFNYNRSAAAAVPSVSRPLPTSTSVSTTYPAAGSGRTAMVTRGPISSTPAAAREYRENGISSVASPPPAGTTSLNSANMFSRGRAEAPSATRSYGSHSSRPGSARQSHDPASTTTAAAAAPPPSGYATRTSTQHYDRPGSRGADPYQTSSSSYGQHAAARGAAAHDTYDREQEQREQRERDREYERERDRSSTAAALGQRVSNDYGLGPSSGLSGAGRSSGLSGSCGLGSLGGGGGSGYDRGGVSGGGSGSGTTGARTTAPPVGFRNMGNTCYMNSVLQCVVHGAGAFANELAETEVRHPRANAGATSATVTESTVRLRCDGGSKNLLAVKGAVGASNSEFAGLGQNDSHEFLRVMLLCLHKEVNRINAQPRFRELKDIDGEQPDAMAARWGQYHLERDNSVVYDVFGGQLETCSTCLSCNRVSRSFDPSLDISLPMSSSSSSSTSRSSFSSSLTSSSAMKLEDCLQLFCKENSLKFPCPKCKKESHTQHTSVVKWPRTLALHLKRFNSYGTKNRARVDYPKELDVRRLASQKDINLPSHADVTNHRYHLTGVVCHHGSSSFGHYTAYVRPHGGAQWYECDDSSVRQVAESTVLSAREAAYILFYSAVRSSAL